MKSHQSYDCYLKLLVFCFLFLFLASCSRCAFADGTNFSAPVTAQQSTQRYALWNGFLNMTNILEVVNLESTAQLVNVTLYNDAGTAQTQVVAGVAPRSQQDIILNDLQGFAEDNYGLVVASTSGNIDLRLSFYRETASDLSGNDYEFAFSLPFQGVLTDASYVSFNTFQPSLAAGEQNNQVQNWLSVANLGSSSSETFMINRYSQTGALVSTREVVVPPLGRSDLEGGHLEGLSVVGMNEIVPSNSSAEYQAQLIRYGMDAVAGQAATGFSFAFPLAARSAAAGEEWVPISSGANAQNWVEVINVSGSTVSAALTFYDNNGNELTGANEALVLAPRSQQHLEASSRLPDGASGAVRISSSVVNSLVVNSVFYFRNSSGHVESIYTMPSRAVSGGFYSGSWNLFLGMYNWLRLFNTQNSMQDVRITVYNNNEVSEVSTSLLPHGEKDIGLHETAAYGSSRNAFGMVTVTGNSLLLDVLRVKPLQNGGVDFIFSTRLESHTAPSWWQPAPGTSWQWQLSGTIDTTFQVNMYDIDLAETPTSTIAQLHADGRTVICYFSAGSWEEFRDDANDFPASVLGQPLSGFPDERWLDIRAISELSPIMRARLDLAVEKGCDGVEPDNVDGYDNNTGFSLTREDQITYNKWIAAQAHSRGLSVGLKNALALIDELEPFFDWALNEQCFEFDECESLLPFIQAGKAVFGVEYQGDPSSFCPQANAFNFDWLKKNLDLDASRVACR